MKRTSMTWFFASLALALAACGGGEDDPSYTCSPTVLDGTCAGGESCIGGVCYADGAKCSPTNTSGVCAPGLGCVDGNCILSQLVCSPTNETGLCSTGSTCVDGTCRPDAELCSATNHGGVCASPGTCHEGVCRDPADFCSPANPSGICSEAGKTCVGGVCQTPEGACSSPENEAHRRAIVAAQPIIGVQAGTGKTGITANATWPSASGGAEVCSVAARFRDSNGNGELDPYEDWTRPVTARVADLLGRLSGAQKAALLAHPTLSDVPTAPPYSVSAATQALVAGGVRFGQTVANAATPAARATWANDLQKACEASALGIPFVLSSGPLHQEGNGRTRSAGFTTWPQELALAAAGGAAQVEAFARYAAVDYRAIGVRMALSPSADLATDARWSQGPFTFGEDAAAVTTRVEAYVKGFQGETLGPASVACVVGSFPGAGAAKDGWDGRLAKGKFLTYPAGKLDDHLLPFQGAVAQGVAGVMPAYGIPETGSWTALSGAIDGATIEQVGVSFNSTLLEGVLRGHYQFTGLVLAPWGVLEDPGLAPLGAPWGKESATRVQRAAAALDAGVDQFAGVSDPAVFTDAVSADLVTEAVVDAASSRVLTLMFTLGLFEDPYVDASVAADVVGSAQAKTEADNAHAYGLVLLKNANKPAGWLNGDPGKGDGSHSGDPGNAGNGSGKVLPAPPGQKYVWHGASYFIGGGIDVAFVRTLAANGHYGELSNDELVVGCDGAPDCTKCDAPTVEKRIACSNYYFSRIPSPAVPDLDSGPLALPGQALSWSGNGLSSALEELAAARAAIDANPGSQTQIVVSIDAGRLPILDEILAFDPAAVYVEWLPPGAEGDRYLIDVAFGFIDGVGLLPVGLPQSDAAVSTSHEDLAGDAVSPAYPRGSGLFTVPF